MTKKIRIRKVTRTTPQSTSIESVSFKAFLTNIFRVLLVDTIAYTSTALITFLILFDVTNKQINGPDANLFGGFFNGAGNIIHYLVNKK
jgi:hypothetical protein